MSAGSLLAGLGLFAAVLGAAAAMLLAPSRRRSLAMLVALVLIPALILGDQWHSTEIADLRHHPARLAGLALAALVAVAAVACLLRRRPALLPLALIAAIPFRVPIHAGGQEANLLVPVYLVIAGGVLARVWGEWRRRSSAGATSVTGPAALRIVLASVLVLYAIQSVYSEDFSRALQNAAFFYVPFALVFVLLSDCRWERRLLVLSLGVVVAEALAFVLFGFWEYAARHLIWNPEVIRSNDFHTYFRVNSLFWDPNVYGRYLALAIVALVAVLLWTRSQRLALGLAGIVCVLWLGLVTTFSQSSFVALLIGLVALAALRWSLRWTAIVCAASAIAAAAFVLAAGGSLKINLSTQQTLNKDTSGRANLVTEGIALFANRPLWGYGSGSFSVAYQRHRRGGSGRLTVSHTEPVTVAAEQGLIGLAAYVAVLVVAFATLTAGMWNVMPGLRPRLSAGGAEVAIAGRAQGSSTAAGATSLTGPAAEWLVGQASRAAILACFCALLAHTMAYAGFLEDPLTWVLLAIGSALAVAPRAALAPPAVRDRGAASMPSAAPA